MSEWISVGTPPKESPLTKQQVKNKRRGERRSKKVPVLPESSSSETEEEDDNETARDLERRFRRLSKTLKQIEQAETKLRRGLDDEAVVAKVRRKASVAAELETVREELEIIEDRRRAANVAAQAAAALVALRREAEAQLVLSVKFDDKFACPICTELVEAAVSVSCSHVFCRACLEDHVAKATGPADCVCPMCRSPLLVDGRVDAKPANVRVRLKYVTGTCHCGAVLPLSKLRDHLRTCGPKSFLFPPRRKFGHEFKQPAFVTAKQKGPSGDWDQIQLQAALLASMQQT